MSQQILAEVAQLGALDLVSAFDAQNRVTRAIAASSPTTTSSSPRPSPNFPPPHGTLRYDDPRHTITSWLRTLFDYGPFTAAFNSSGHPAISLPLAHSRSGLPIGVQLIAAYGREDLLLRTAAQLEQAMPWKHRTPDTLITST